MTRLPRDLKPPASEELLLFLAWSVATNQHRAANVQGDGMMAACQWLYGWGPADVHAELDRLEGQGRIVSQWRDGRRSVRLPWMCSPREQRAAAGLAAHITGQQ